MSRFKWNRIALIALVFAGIGLCAPSALAYGSPAAGSPVKIHVLAFDDADAILVECDGRFGMVDSGEDSDSPTGDDARYPLRPGTTVGKGREREVIAYMESLGVNGDNFDFYIGTHPHSDHIGSADDIIRAFRPQAIYLPYYEDDFITSSSRLWDNLFVYDNLVAAAEWARETYGARFVQFLDDVEVSAVAESDGGEGASESWVRERTGSSSFSLGSATIEILNGKNPLPGDRSFRVPDANFYSYGVKVTGANGRVAFLAGDINDYRLDWSVGGGDETRLVQSGDLSRVDMLKMGHHGINGSDTPAFLRAILSSTGSGSAPIVVQTGQFFAMPLETASVLERAGARHFCASYAAQRGKAALVVMLGDGAVTTNVDGDQLVVQTRKEAPWAFLYANGRRISYPEGWRSIEGTMRYFERDGSLCMGWKSWKGRWYYCDWADGSMETGWVEVSGKPYYFQANGAMLESRGWQRVEGRWHFFDKGGNGDAKVGWLKDGGAWYYLRPGTGAMATGWAQDGPTWYYLDGSGAMRTGWQRIGGSWYYLAGSGAMRTGWLKSGGAWYLLRDSGAMATGWAQVDGAWYYLRPGSGAMAEGWQAVGGTWYYLDGSGAMRTGWLKDKGKWYYLTGSGAMATGERVIGGVSYSFDDSGALR